MKAFALKSESALQHVKKDRQRPASRPAVFDAEADSRDTAFVDNRPGAMAQRQLQARIDQSPRVRHLAQRQAMINGSPRQVAQRQQTAYLSGQAMHGRTEQTASASLQPLRPSMTLGSTGEVAQLAGTKPNQPSEDGKYRIKLSSKREHFTYENRVALGLDNVLPKHHRWIAYSMNKAGVFAVQLEDLTMVFLKAPIPEPTGGQKMLVIDTVGDESKLPWLSPDEPKATKLFMDIKIGHFTKSGQQFKLEGANPFMRRFKQIEHDMKDKSRTSDEFGYDIDKDNLKAFDAAYEKAKSGQEPTLANAMFTIWKPLVEISKIMAKAPVTFVGASVFIVLNLTRPWNSEVKIIDPDHPILLDQPPLLQDVPEGVMSGTKMLGGRDWDEYVQKWQWNFGSGMTKFLKWWDGKADELLPKLQ